jgi:hypothetical protein
VQRANRGGMKSASFNAKNDNWDATVPLMLTVTLQSLKLESHCWNADLSLLTDKGRADSGCAAYIAEAQLANDSHAVVAGPESCYFFLERRT